MAILNNDPTGSVFIDGTAKEGKSLRAANSLDDKDGVGTISYQWKRAGTAIAGANGLFYYLVQADVGSSISVTASYTDGQGTAESVSSSSTSAVANVNDAPTGLVTIIGTATEGEKLEVSNTLADSDGLGMISFQWKRDGTTIDGANGSTYVLTPEDVGSNISVVASYTDGQGTAESVSSSSTSSVESKPVEPPVVFNPPSDPIEEVYEVQVQNYRVSETVLSRLNDFNIQSLEDIGYTFETVSDDDFNIVTEQTGDGEMVGTPYEVQRDWISGGKASLYHQGYRGEDLIQAGQGDDILRGGKGNDVLIAGAGDDVIYDDLGNDLMIGAAGRDEFRVGNGYNVIVDFETEFDTLVVQNGSNFTLHEVSGGTLVKYDEGETFLSGLTDTSVLV